MNFDSVIHKTLITIPGLLCTFVSPLQSPPPLPLLLVDEIFMGLFVFCLIAVCQPSHLPTWLWCQLLLPWWWCPLTVDFDFLARSPCPRPCCEDCLNIEISSEEKCFTVLLDYLSLCSPTAYFPPFPLLCHHLWSLNTHLYFLIHIRCPHLAMCPAWPPPWPPPTPPSSPTPGPRSSPRQRASSSVNFRGLKSVSELMKSFLRLLPLPEFWNDSAA